MEPGAADDLGGPTLEDEVASAAGARPKQTKRPPSRVAHDSSARESDITMIARSRQARKKDPTSIQDLPYVANVGELVDSLWDKSIGHYAKTNPDYGQQAKLHFRCAATDSHFRSMQNRDPLDLDMRNLEQVRNYLKANIQVTYQFWGAEEDKGIIHMTEDPYSTYFDRSDALAKMLAKTLAKRRALEAGATQEDVDVMDNLLREATENEQQLQDEEDSDDDDDDGGEHKVRKAVKNAQATVEKTTRKLQLANKKQEEADAIKTMIPNIGTGSILGIRPFLIKNKRYGEGKLSFHHYDDLSSASFGLNKDPTMLTLKPCPLSGKARSANAFWAAHDTVHSKSTNAEVKESWAAFGASGKVPKRLSSKSGYSPGDEVEFANAEETRKHMPDKYANPLKYIMETLKSGVLRRSTDSVHNSETLTSLSRHADLFCRVGKSSAIELMDDLAYAGNFESAANRAANWISVYDTAGGLVKMNALLGRPQSTAPRIPRPKQNGRRAQQRIRGEGRSSDDDDVSDEEDDKDHPAELSSRPRYLQLLHLATTRGGVQGVVSIIDELCSVGASNTIATYICGLRKDRSSRTSGKDLAIDIIFKLKFHAVIVGESFGYISGHRYIDQVHSFRRPKPLVELEVVIDGKTQWVPLDSVRQDPDKSAIFVGIDPAILFEPYIDAESKAAEAAAAAAAAAAAMSPGPERGVIEAHDPLPFQRNDAVCYQSGRGDNKIDVVARVARWDETRSAYVVQEYMKNGIRQRYANEVTRDTASLSKIDTELMIQLQWKNELPPLPPLRSISNKEKQKLNVLCTCCEQRPTPNNAAYCECWEEDIKNLWQRQRPVPEGKKWAYVCDSPVCRKLLQEHQATCAQAMAALAEVAEPEPMDVADDVGNGPAPPPVPRAHDSPNKAQSPIREPEPPAASAITTFMDGVHTLSSLVRNLYKEDANLVQRGLLVTTYNEDAISACRNLGNVESVCDTGRHCIVSWLDGGVSTVPKKARKTKWDMGDLSFVETRAAQVETDLMALRNGSYYK